MYFTYIASGRGEGEGEEDTVGYSLPIKEGGRGKGRGYCRIVFPSGRGERRILYDTVFPSGRGEGEGGRGGYCMIQSTHQDGVSVRRKSKPKLRKCWDQIFEDMRL